MSITIPNAGTLQKPMSLEICTQEQAYRALLCLPDLPMRTREQLIAEIAMGEEMEWIHQTLVKKLYAWDKNSDEKRCTKLAKRLLEVDRAGYAMLILECPASSPVRVRAMKKLLHNPRYAGMLIRSDRRLKKAETDVIIKKLLPKLNTTNANPLLERIRRNEVSTKYRTRVIEGLTKGEPHYVWWEAKFLIQADAKKELVPRLSKVERLALLKLIPEGNWRLDMLVDTLRKDKYDNCKLTETEQRLFAPSVVEHLSANPRSLFGSSEQAVTLLLQNKKLFTEDEIARLEKALASLQANAA